MNTVKEQTFYADTFGSSITQQRVRVQPSLSATTVDAGGWAMAAGASISAAVSPATCSATAAPCRSDS